MAGVIALFSLIGLVIAPTAGRNAADFFIEPMARECICSLRVILSEIKQIVRFPKPLWPAALKAGRLFHN